ncbi:hypothetical protein IC582_010932 [Cucumis melo]
MFPQAQLPLTQLNPPSPSLAIPINFKDHSFVTLKLMAQNLSNPSAQNPLTPSTNPYFPFISSPLHNHLSSPLIEIDPTFTYSPSTNCGPSSMPTLAQPQSQINNQINPINLPTELNVVSDPQLSLSPSSSSIEISFQTSISGNPSPSPMDLFVPPSTQIFPTHPMITQAKSNIFKPKTLISTTAMDWSLTEPIRIKQALATPQWKQAMDEEYSALLKAQTWHLVPPSPSQKVVGNKWVFRLKCNTDGSIQWYKTRLVAKGFHQHLGVDFFETFSPVVKVSTIRVILNLAVTNGWQLRQLDFNNAFLNGNLTKTVYIQKPPGYVHPSFPNYVCKLDKAIYGLKQSPRAWNETLSKKLFSWGFENSKSNSSLFILRCRSSIILLLVYVDDVVVTGNDTKLIDELVRSLDKQFSLKDLGILTYFLGFQIHYFDSGFVLNQEKYVDDLLQKLQFQDLKPTHSPSVAGKHLSLSEDANWASNIDDRKSVAAYCVFIGNNLVSWSSKKQTVVARSSTKSEYRALALAASEVIWLKQLLFQLNVNLPLKPVIWYDKVSAGTLATNPVFHARTKHIKIDVHFVRDHVLRGTIDVRYVPSADQLADCLTKFGTDS